MNNDFLKKVKNIIIIIVVLLSIIFICLVILNNIKKEKNTYDPNYTVGLEKRNMHFFLPNPNRRSMAVDLFWRRRLEKALNG